MDKPIINWPGKSGRIYTYYIYPIGSSFRATGGNYIFAKETSPSHWSPVYVGQTVNLGERFDEHHKMFCIRQQGGTHIHVHLNDIESVRLGEESDLIEKWNPPCNG